MIKEKYDVVIVGAGPAGLFTAYGLLQQNKDFLQKPKRNLSIVILEKGNDLDKRTCPSIAQKTKCLKCPTCSITEGVSGAGAFSDGKFPITNDFGGTLWEKIGKEKALELMRQVDTYNQSFFNKVHPDKAYPKLFSSKNSFFKKICIQHNLNLLDADIRHLGTDYCKDIYKVLVQELKENGVEIYTNTEVTNVSIFEHFKKIECNIDGIYHYIQSNQVVMAPGRSGSEWVKKLCTDLNIPTISNRVDIGVRFECPNEIWDHITKDLYEGKITYQSKTYEDIVRTFCMNPSGIVVTEKTDGRITVNGHSFEDSSKKTNNTNFALLVGLSFTEPFNDSSSYGDAVISLSNMLGGGVIVQRYGDLIKGKRSTKKRIEQNSVTPTLQAEPGDLSLVLPKRILDDILEMIEALDHLVPGMKNSSNLLYGVEYKKYGNIVVTKDNFECNQYKGLYFIGDGSGYTHSLSQASASGLFLAEQLSDPSLY